MLPLAPVRPFTELMQLTEKAEKYPVFHWACIPPFYWGILPLKSLFSRYRVSSWRVDEGGQQRWEHAGRHCFLGKKGQLINLSHHVLGNHVLRLNLFLTVQGSSRSAEPGTGEGRADPPFMLADVLQNTTLSEAEKWTGRVKHLSFVISKFAVQSLLLPRFHNSLWTCCHSLFFWLVSWLHFSLA